MQSKSTSYSVLSLMVVLLMGTSSANAALKVQCPGDTDGDAVIDTPDPDHPDAVCVHLTAGDGFVKMADGKVLYMFGFADATGVPVDEVMSTGMLAAEFPSPTLVLNEGQEMYLTLSNVGMMMRPDLFDPHTVHWHGYPNAASIFDGVPEASVSINMGSSMTYYYVAPEPGTYMYHCHVEATEHMQMGMLGNLYVHPAQNGKAFQHRGRIFTRFAYNDLNGSTGYDVEYAIQLGSFDPVFHDASLNVQPLPFAGMEDRYAMLNGRGYPDTVDPAPLPGLDENGGKVVQKESSLVTAVQGERILLRLSNLNVTRFYSLGVLGVKMRIVGKDAKMLRGPSPDGITPGLDLSYMTSSVSLGGGESADAIIDTADFAPGTYFLYATDLNYLSNDGEDFGGMMTEIHILPAAL